MPTPQLAQPPARVDAVTPPANDDVEQVKRLAAMGFNRDQAVAALEANDYDFQKALDGLLGA